MNWNVFYFVNVFFILLIPFQILRRQGKKIQIFEGNSLDLLN